MVAVAIFSYTFLKEFITFAPVEVLKIFGVAGVLSITSSDTNSALSITRKEILLPFGLFSNVPFVVRKVILFSTTCLSTLILLLNTQFMMVGLSTPQFHQPFANRVWNGQETVSYLRPNIWNMVPEEMK